jgi:hypothetical protein
MDASNFGDSTGIFILYTLDTCRTSLGRSPAGPSFGAVHPQMIPLPAAGRIEGVSRLEISGSRSGSGMIGADHPRDELVECRDTGDAHHEEHVRANRESKSHDALPATSPCRTLRFVGCATFRGHITQPTNDGKVSTTTIAATTKIKSGSNRFGSYRG